ncbi:hypothetical protein SAMN05421752_11644 [Natronorubrum thiooxidans]|uniref:Uncharacterized protein n=1 Tax=Natronorubrum thiooxidans TaxID=308853 RepID=A0A1N7GW46_9EURY|nr:hypothetical protein SAMN05421752_11644 [Natronorubrum thiooxidans]
MNNGEQRTSSGADRAIEEGETYSHTEHGHAEVTGIWHRTHSLDTTRTVDDQDMIIVRFVPGENGDWMDEQAELLDDFLNAIN